MTLAPRKPKQGAAGKLARKGDRTRASILDAAEKLFAHAGYRATSLAAVAEAADITQAGLLYHFPSKEALLLGLLADRDEPVLDDGVAGLRTVEALQELYRTSLGNPQLVRLFTVVILEGLAADHPAGLYVQDRYANVRADLMRRLRAGVADGQIRPETDLGIDAMLLTAMMDGLSIQWLLNPEFDVATAFDRFAGLLRGAMASPQAQDDATRPGA